MWLDSPMDPEKASKLQELVDKLSQKQLPDINWFTHQLGELAKSPPLIGILICLMLLDIVSGFIAATIHKEVDSSCSYKGMLKKGQMLLMVAAGMMFEFIYPDVPWGRIIAFFMCISEMISIVENAGKAGVPLPVQLKETLRRLRQSEKEDNLQSKVSVQINAPTAKEIKVTDSKLAPQQVDKPVTHESEVSINEKRISG